MHPRLTLSPKKEFRGAPDGSTTIGHYEAQGATCLDCGRAFVRFTPHVTWGPWTAVADLHAAQLAKVDRHQHGGAAPRPVPKRDAAA